MSYHPINLKNFPGREEALKKIIRYTAYPIMFYRTNVFIHSQRVMWIIEDLSKLALKFLPKINIDKARTLALVHDDAEIITGDIQLGHKLYMTKEQLAKIDENEEKAIEILSEKYPKEVNGFSYKELLQDALEKGNLNSPIEAQILNYADRCDALCEALHEIYAGNQVFCTDHPDFEKDVNPVSTYTKILTEFPDKFPKLKPLLSQQNPFAKIPSLPDQWTIVKNSEPHTKESLLKETNNPLYNHWKKLLLQKGKDDELQKLIQQKEFPV